ncbi:MAG: hypothetical protein J6C28_04400 [Bacilli bacterium]|nr:hypothetical protein [Bacilli bacterium]
MSNGRKLLFVISFLIIDLLLIGSILIMRDFTGKNLLKNEVNALIELDFKKDKYNTEIKSIGSYAVAEEALKKYLDDYAVEVQNVLRVRYDQRLNNMLTIDNYNEEAPFYTDSLNYLDNLRNNFNYNIDILMERVSEEAIYNHINNYDADKDSVNIYNNILIESNLVKKIEDNQNDLIKKRIEINSYIDSIYDVLVFLRDNPYYSVISEKIVFSDEGMQNKYYELISKTKRIYE